MNTEFLSNVMHVAKEITRAERGLAVDNDLTIHSSVNLDESAIQAPKFNELALSTLSQAIEQKEAIITNNLVLDPARLPQTNKSFSDLRVVVALPVPGGAIYLDQHIRQGVIPREVIDKIIAFIERVVDDGQETLSVEELLKRYNNNDL